ncbi:hypothetical protein Anas_03344 [Armadillidium nasatum]|uniref:BED-type domain-containing protein n=1 Tax=Armadillidium nasatum TaxID=96803 RepID=A0A5N5TAN9_9CRUS|nr:hypothetical protein Anas_03344 [Armadillidium nasatum]
MKCFKFILDILQLRIFKMPGEHKRSSSVWKFFTKVNGTESSCNICDQVCRSSGNTTNLRNHLRTKHYEAFKALYEMTEDLAGVCAASRMEWGQCHSPEIDEAPTDSADATTVVNKEVTVKKEGKRKYIKRKKKDVESVETTPHPLKNIKIEDVSTVKPDHEHDLDIFGRCIAAQLKKLSEKRAILLTLEINNLVGEARIEDIDEQLANKAAAGENPHVITVSYGDPICNQSDDNNGNLEIMQN